ncbi:MAG TPA: rRNA maturation RNase YbeY [Armatimonadota bacterium]|jgi:probable rRNA maturation factor
MSRANPPARRPLLEVRDLQTAPLPLPLLEETVRQALALSGQELDGLSLVLVDAARIARLNEAFLEHEGPTDVISFPAEDGEEGRSGEVIVCVPVAQEQAVEWGHSLSRELAILVAHGTLHAVGYTDDTDAGRAEMADLQTRAADLALAATNLT